MQITGAIRSWLVVAAAVVMSACGGGGEGAEEAALREQPLARSGPTRPPKNLWQPPAGATPASGNYVYLQSDAGDYIGAGATITYTQDVSIDRNALSAGWFVTPVLLMKGEYMKQNYYRFPARDIRNGGKIQGFVIEGVVSF